jgi:hypothetical protein
MASISGQARRPRKQRNHSVALQVLEPPESTMLDLIDHLLEKGVMATGDLTLGVANVDLIYLRLSSLLCAADRLIPVPGGSKSRSRHRRRVRRRA